MAVRPGGSGNVTGSHRLWKTEKKTPQRIGSGVIQNGHLYLSNALGTLECIEARTGKLVWKERMSGNLWGSLLLADEKLYVSNLEGDTFVVRAGLQFELLAKNSLGETIHAAPTPSNGELLLRTYKHLYCITGSSAK
jgi:outer membrane protein assembly factor BamB